MNPLKRTSLLMLCLVLTTLSTKGQTLSLDKELKELLRQSVEKDYQLKSRELDREQTLESRKALKAAYLPKLELGGKYLYAYTTVDTKMGEITGFESLQQFEELLQNPAFPLMFPGLAQLSTEITKLQQLMAQQGMSLPTLKKELDGTLSGNYAGLDATAKILLYSGGQIPNAIKALEQKEKAQSCLKEKEVSDRISEVIALYDQLALLKQSEKVLEKSGERLAAEKKFASTALRNGLAAPYDTLRIAVAEASLDSKKAEFRNKQTMLHLKLSQLSGQPAAQISGLDPDLSVIPYNAQNTDISGRPELQALNANLEAKKFMLQSEKSHYLPKVQAMASLRYDYIFSTKAAMDAPLASDIHLDHLAMGPTILAGAGFKWDLYDRSAGSSKQKLAGLEVRKAGLAAEEARELLMLNLEKSRNNYLSALTQLEYRKKQREAASQALELAMKSYSEGMLSISERIAAETELQNAEFEYLQAIYSQRQSALECFKATAPLSLELIK